MTPLNFQPLLPFPGFAVGHFTDLDHATGCSVVLCPEGAVGGVDVRGGAPGTRETALLDPTCKVNEVHGIALSGGSAFGLAAADGTMRWLAEQGYGYAAGTALIPIVPGAIIFDLGIGPVQGNEKPIPTADDAYQACVGASREFTAEGCVGAGTGGTVGKFLGMAQACKGGLGATALELQNGLRVGALMVVNALGNVMTNSQILAGARDPKTNQFVDFTERLLAKPISKNQGVSNTTIGVVLTNADFTKAEVTKVAQMAHSGIARAIDPSHTQHDGDTIFALSCGQQEADVSQVGALAAHCVARAIARAVKKATPLFDIPATSGVKPLSISNK